MPKPRDWHAWTTAFLAPWNAHDVEAVLATLPHDFSWQFPAGVRPEGTIYRGHTELRPWLTRFFAMVPDLNYVIVDLHPGDNHLVMEVLVTGHNIETGQALHFQACDIVLFDGETPRGKRSYRKVVTPA
jgi:ketosteroid isomerase-like protein